MKNTKWVRNAIDRFALVRLEQNKIGPSPEADRATLIRRLSFDLIGLPPAPAEVQAFISDPSRDAYEKLVERLLASPHYGERWGRHWLDAAGYADSNGYFDADSDRPFAYKYRDYVVKSLNDDKPFDRFVQEQIAGDELAGYAPDGDVPPEMAELLVATHLLRNAPDGTGESDGNPQELAADRYAVLEGNVQLIGSAFLGITIQCARCHDHKFEPITQEEYYQLQAILKPAYNHDQWLKPNERAISVGSRAEREATKRQIEKFEREFKTLQESRDGLIKPFQKLTVAENLETLPAAARAEVQKALDTVPKQRTEEMKALLKRYQAQVEITDADLIKRFPEIAPGYQALRDQIKKREAERPKPLPQIAALTDVTPEPPRHHLLARGNYTKPARAVDPGVPAVFCTPNNRYVAGRLAPPPTAGSGAERVASEATLHPGKPASSGRRLALARWLTSPENPVVARVTVNRIWQHHFGAGLVETPENFGLTGAKPSNPELLDWLATEFVRSGWSVKSLHRLIVTSATYRQGSVEADGRRLTSKSGTRSPLPGFQQGLVTSASTKTLMIDPDDHFLWHFPLRRLDAEAIRDAMLSVSGELDPTVGGPFVPLDKTEEGQFVVPEKNPGCRRRSLYLQQRRTKPLTMLDVFDGAQMNPNCTRRSASTVPLQSLALLNSEFVRARSQAFAQRVLREAGAGNSDRITRSFEFAFGRPPKEDERKAAEEFLQSQPGHYDGKPDAGERAWTDLCQMLLASNSFLYVE